MVHILKLKKTSNFYAHIFQHINTFIYISKQVGEPIYVFEYNALREQLILGIRNKVAVYWLDFEYKAKSIFSKEKPSFSYEHTDIVTCVNCSDSRVYSAGYVFMIFT